MAVQFVNNSALLSSAFDRVAGMNDPQVAALQRVQAALPTGVAQIQKKYNAGQIAEALGPQGTNYNAAAQRAMALGDEETALKYADLYDKSLTRQDEADARKAMLGIELAKIDAVQAKANLDMAKAAQAQIKSQEALNAGLEDLDAIAKSGDLTTWGYRRAKAGFGTDTHRAAEGKLKAAIAAIAPAAIQRLKEAGVSGINTQGEFFNYIGLPENPTSEQLAGAMPRLKATLGYSGGFGVSPVPGTMTQSKYSGLM